MVRAKIRYVLVNVNQEEDAQNLSSKIRTTMTKFFGLVSARIEFRGSLKTLGDGEMANILLASSFLLQ